MNYKLWRRNLLPVLFLALILITGCRGCNYSNDVNISEAPGIKPVVDSVVPLNRATNVAINSNLTVTFSKPMSSANASTTFLLKTGGTLVKGAVTYDEMIGKFDPDLYLATSTYYTVTVTTDTKDTEGHSLVEDYVWSFTTGLFADEIRPTVVSTNAADGAGGVPVNRSISALFSEIMDPLTINATTFQLKGPGDVTIAGKVTYVGVTAIFTPSANLTEGAVYNGRITNGVKDVAGNSMLADYTWSFTGLAAETTKPTVSSTDPEPNETGVATNKKIAIIFSEEMNPLTVNSTTLTLKDPSGTAVAGAVTYAGLTANFTPTLNLTSGTTYTAAVSNGATDLAGNALAASFVWSFTAGAGADSAAPTVVSTDPFRDAENVAINQRLAATFNEGMEAASVNTTTFTVKKANGTTVDGTVTFAGLVANFVPTANLEANIVYTATITNGVKDLAGNPMAANYVWSFTSGSILDNTAPTVASTDPAHGDTDVASNKKVAITFSESMNPATLNPETLTVTGPGTTAVAGIITYTSPIAYFTPSAALQSGIVYTGKVSNGAKDLAGNAVVPYVWTFTAGSADSAAPTIVSTDPVAKAQNIAINKTIAATFSEGMSAASINATSFTLTKLNGPAVSGAVSYSGLIANFNPDANLDINATYTAVITTAAKDLAGNALAANRTWQFKTGTTADTTAPVVSSTDPLNNATGVATNKKIAVTFSENMDSSTIKTSTFTVTKPDGTAVSGTVTYTDRIANFAPTAALASTATYTARVTTGVKDLSGNPLATIYTWKFTTGTVQDLTAPTVESTDPGVDAINVPFNKTVSVTFSETMNSATINTSTFTVKKQSDNTPVIGVVSYNGLTAYFNPDENLIANTFYTATVSTGAKDMAGNPLALKVWSFKTGLAADEVAPLVVLPTIPADKAENVAINTTVGVKFNEAMTSGTLNTNSFTLTRLGGAAVIGTINYSAMIASFTPNSNLAYDATYTARITTEAEDLAGNNLATAYTWDFKTVAAPDTTRPTITFTDPATNETGVAINKTLAVTFSENMKPSTLDDTTFLLKKKSTGVAVIGVVSYSGLIAKFNPNIDLEGSATYTATIKSGVTGVKDLAGNSLLVDKVWDFQTGALPDSIKPTVTSTKPILAEVDVAINQPIQATFSESMDADTINDLTFKIAGKTGTVTYDALTRIATFKPTTNFAINTPYTATITNGVQDLAGNTMLVDKVWNFTTGQRTLAQPVALGDAAPFGNFGGSSGMTNQGILTVVNGDIGTTGASTMITGFHDAGGNVYTETTSNKGLVTGVIYTATAPPGSVPGEKAAAGAYDMNQAYINLSPAALPGGIDVSIYGGGPGDLGNRVLKPGIYQSAPGTFNIQGGPLTLDAQGDANAVWVFQMASTLTVGGPGAAAPQSIVLTNGAQAKNIFWQVGSAATINAGGGGTMMGTIIAQAGVTFSTAGNVTVVTLNGRALSLNASVTLVNTVINIPAE